MYYKGRTRGPDK